MGGSLSACAPASQTGGGAVKRRVDADSLRNENNAAARLTRNGFGDRRLNKIAAAVLAQYPYLEHVGESMLVTDLTQPDCPIIYANDDFERMCLFPKEAILGVNCRFLQGRFTNRATVDKIRDAVQRAEPLEVEILNYRRDGVAFWNNFLMLPVNKHGRVAADKSHYFIAIQKNISYVRAQTQPLDWSPPEVAMWLEHVGFRSCAASWCAQSVGGAALLSLTVARALELGVAPFAEAERLLLLVERLRRVPGSAWDDAVHRAAVYSSSVPREEIAVRNDAPVGGGFVTPNTTKPSQLKYWNGKDVESVETAVKVYYRGGAGDADHGGVASVPQSAATANNVVNARVLNPFSSLPDADVRVILVAPSISVNELRAEVAREFGVLNVELSTISYTRPTSVKHEAAANSSVVLRPLHHQAQLRASVQGTTRTLHLAAAPLPLAAAVVEQALSSRDVDDVESVDRARLVVNELSLIVAASPNATAMLRSVVGLKGLPLAHFVESERGPLQSAFVDGAPLNQQYFVRRCDGSRVAARVTFRLLGGGLSLLLFELPETTSTKTPRKTTDDGTTGNRTRSDDMQSIGLLPSDVAVRRVLADKRTPLLDQWQREHWLTLFSLVQARRKLSSSSSSSSSSSKKERRRRERNSLAPFVDVLANAGMLSVSDLAKLKDEQLRELGATRSAQREALLSVAALLRDELVHQRAQTANAG